MKNENARLQDPDGKHRILLVDDHPMVCEGLAQWINAEPDLEVCAQAHTAPAALEAIDKFRPHLAVVDIALGSGSGVELIKDIKVRHPHLPSLVLSMHDEALYAERSLHAGAKGYVMKEEETDVLLKAIRHVLRGEVYLSEKVKDRIVNRLGGILPGDEITFPTDKLSDRELQVFELIGDGYATHEIAEQLHLSMKTIASHRENIRKKLNLGSGEELLRYAIHMLRYRASATSASVAAESKPSKEIPRKVAKSPRRTPRMP